MGERRSRQVDRHSDRETVLQNFKQKRVWEKSSHRLREVRRRTPQYTRIDNFQRWVVPYTDTLKYSLRLLPGMDISLVQTH